MKRGSCFLILLSVASAVGMCSAGQVDYPFSDFTAFHSFRSQAADDEHSVSEPLPAYLLPQDPYAAALLPFLKPPLNACSGPELTVSQLQQLWSALPASGSNTSDVFPEAFQLAHKAAIWGIPSVQVAAAFTKSALNKTAAFPQLTINGLVHYSDPLDSTRQPQAGTQDVNFLYSLAWVDLTGGPLVLSVPASAGRFYELQFVNVYNEVPMLIGPLTSSLGKGITSAVKYVLAPYGYNTTIPDGYNYTAYMDSNTLWVIGRTAVVAENASDLAAAQAVQRGFTLGPLFPKSYPKPFAVAARDLNRRGVVASVRPYRLWGGDKGPFVTTEDFYPESTPIPQYKNTSAFWELLGAITALNPPRNEQAKLYAQFESLGLSLRGFGFDPNSLPDSTISGLNAGLASALICVISSAQTQQKASVTNTRWAPLIGQANYGNDYQARAVGATIALGVNPKSISISYLSRSATDRDNWGPGRSLHGGLYNYTLSFPQAPSVSTSWSLTPYNMQNELFTAVPYNASASSFRYSINGKTPGLDTSSGSVTLYISATAPAEGTVPRSNWLPIGPKPFYLVLRLYGPSETAQQGNYIPPPIYAFAGPPQALSIISDMSSLNHVLQSDSKELQSQSKP